MTSKVPPDPAPISNRRWHMLYAAVVLGLFGTISLGWFGVGQRIGDGTGFYVMFFAWAENGTPYSTQRVGQKFVEYVQPRPEWAGNQHYYSVSNPMVRKDGTADESHFWLYSMLAAVFYWPLKLLGADVGLSFNCLHVVLLYVAVVLVHRRLGPAAACSLVILVVGSPVLWYANKAHTELFTVVLGSLGAAYLVAGEHAPSALCFALVATQNPAFGLVALLVLAMGVVGRWCDRLRTIPLSHEGEGGTSVLRPHPLPLSQPVARDRRERGALLAHWKMLAVVAAVLALHPAYYWLRARAASPMLIGPELLMRSYWLPLRHIASFWIDPDIGLLATWPLGLPLLVAGVVMFVRRWRAPGAHLRRRMEYAVFFVLSSLLLTWSYARLSTGFGGGGTVDVSRYSVWLIFLFFPILWQVVVWVRQVVERNSFRSVERTLVRSNGLKSVLRKCRSMLVLAGLALLAFSAWLYRPWLDETSRRPTCVSNWLYANLSRCYDPLPRIFYYSRGGRRELYGEDVFRWSDWAVSDASGNKILVAREPFVRQSPETPATVVGRGCLDPKVVYQIAEEQFARYPRAEYCYINQHGQELFRPPPLPLGRETMLGKQGHPERFLASGWFPPEANGTWSSGERAELVFQPEGAEAGRTYAIHLQIVEVAGAGHRPQLLEPALNGVSLGLVEILAPATFHWFVGGEKLQGPTTLSLVMRNPVSPRQARLGSDTRQLGVKVAALRIQPLKPPAAADVGRDAQQKSQAASEHERGRQEGKPSVAQPPADSGKQPQKR